MPFCATLGPSRGNVPAEGLDRSRGLLRMRSSRPADPLDAGRHDEVVAENSSKTQIRHCSLSALWVICAKKKYSLLGVAL
jgi:hypothetical protein